MLLNSPPRDFYPITSATIRWRVSTEPATLGVICQTVRSLSWDELMNRLRSWDIALSLGRSAAFSINIPPLRRASSPPTWTNPARGGWWLMLCRYHLQDLSPAHYEVS